MLSSDGPQQSMDDNKSYLNNDQTSPLIENTTNNQTIVITKTNQESEILPNDSLLNNLTFNPAFLNMRRCRSEAEKNDGDTIVVINDGNNRQDYLPRYRSKICRRQYLIGAYYDGYRNGNRVPGLPVSWLLSQRRHQPMNSDAYNRIDWLNLSSTTKTAASEKKPFKNVSYHDELKPMITQSEDENKPLTKKKVLDENLVNDLRRLLTFGNKDISSFNRRISYSEHETTDDDQQHQEYPWHVKPARSILKSSRKPPSPTKLTSLPVKYERNYHRENTIYHYTTVEKSIYEKRIIESTNDDENSHFHYNAAYLPQIRHDSGYSSQYERSHLQKLKPEIIYNHNEYLPTADFDRFADFTPNTTTSSNVDSDFLEPIVTDLHLLKNLSPIAPPSFVYDAEPSPLIIVCPKPILNEQLIIRDNNNTNVHPLLENEFDLRLPLPPPPPVPDRSLKPPHLRPKPARLVEIPTRKHRTRQTSSDEVSTSSITSSLLTNNVTSSIDDNSLQPVTPQQNKNQFERYDSPRKLPTTTGNESIPRVTIPDSPDSDTTKRLVSHIPIIPKPRQSLLNKQKTSPPDDTNASSTSMHGNSERMQINSGLSDPIGPLDNTPPLSSFDMDPNRDSSTSLKKTNVLATISNLSTQQTTPVISPRLHSSRYYCGGLTEEKDNKSVKSPKRKISTEDDNELKPRIIMYQEEPFHSSQQTRLSSENGRKKNAFGCLSNVSSSSFENLNQSKKRSINNQHQQQPFDEVTNGLPVRFSNNQTTTVENKKQFARNTKSNNQQSDASELSSEKQNSIDDLNLPEIKFRKDLPIKTIPSDHLIMKHPFNF
ncbi:unnamed protein product [Didymodactylos carnosus]|uniref:Uncharacterized protein n=1 Tax=Didymodactylos carnosus TaxID=1234261 RepID=A0A8S2QJH8_9BILA|nr:unnamed protein product [Didymodactylos carnosus]CAF4101744.1 unnamed protein product [Didymodactylos carnosus]